MKKTVIALAAAAMTAPLAANAETSWFGFSQITGEMTDTNSGNNEGLTFGADRIRIGYKASEGDAFAKLQLDFNRNGSPDGIGVNDIIKDAVVGYELAPAAKVSLGVFKTPLGMDFTTSGKKLDITKRGMEKGLALERAAGAMFSGDIGGGLGYDVGIFNPANRSGAVGGQYDSDDNAADQLKDGNGNVNDPAGPGEDMAYAGRLRYDMDNLHLQAAYGSSANAGASSVTEDLDGDGEDDVDGTYTITGHDEDYTVMNFGAKYTMDPLTLKFEYMAGENVYGADGRDENVMYLHGGFMLNESTELVARHYMASATRDDSDNTDDTDLTNTYIGANFFLNDKMRIQANYVMAGGDTEGDYTGGPSGGYDNNAILTQFQYSF